MDSSATVPLFSSIRVVGDMNGRSFISPLRVPLLTTGLTAFSPLSEQQRAEMRPTSIEDAWPVTAGLGVRVLKDPKKHKKGKSHSLGQRIAHAPTDPEGFFKFIKGLGIIDEILEPGPFVAVCGFN
ncbi:hypothetical protein AVEN_175740-1 [Araneus ventricosus]|uniref:Uncharacterized protein n=1 Tax=Araneus ventricosus TaxID=182803 RepID=A0A4Y2LFS6_ARAVE|nr:hypothetical protein AVEN_175740-1 [Araneus ventricosus]